MTAAEFGKVLRIVRQARGLLQGGLAERMQYTQARVCLFESGEALPTFEALLEWARVVQCGRGLLQRLVWELANLRLPTEAVELLRKGIPAPELVGVDATAEILTELGEWRFAAWSERALYLESLA